MKDLVPLAALGEPALWESARERVYASTDEDVTRALDAEHRTTDHLAALLSPAAVPRLAALEEAARRLTLQRFGRTVVLYVPLYLSNACTNSCSYCGFARHHDIRRATLTEAEVDVELSRLAEQRFRHLLLLTGEDRRAASVAYIRDAVARCHARFSSVSVEVYPMTTAEYAVLVAAGCDGLTLYQETYHRPTYRAVHPAGPKADYDQRLATPLRAAAAGVRAVSLGALLGLADWRVEGVLMALHGALLRRSYWRTRLGFGFPRLRTEPGAGIALLPLTERDLGQLICGLRLCFPDADLVLSTRERAGFRDRMVGIGVTRMSAGSRTSPGGYALGSDAGEQFAVTDTRTPAEIATMLETHGYEPVWKDFDQGFLA
ncbi:MAG: 2-iminoacetate synthase ThiH [Deltaproteobacteria bacterium]|nr:2-iminoacetate synthase ThiH [Deltaproteobacteria bacterium]